MRKLIFFVGLTGCIHSTPAQTPREFAAVPTEKKSHSGGLRTFLRNIHLELPQVEAKYSIPIRDKKFLTLPFGMNSFMYPIQSSFSPIVENYTPRIIAAFYKDKIGLEFYFDGFGGKIDMNGYNHVMAAQFSNYYYTSIIDNNFYFYGPAFGIAYRIHWKSLIVEPKFIVGFETKDSSFTNFSAAFKEKGSNQFIDYAVRQIYTSPHQHSFHPRLQVGRRFHFKKRPTEIECGAVGDFIYSPYSFRTEIFQQAYGSLPVTQILNVKSTYRQYNIGIYVKIYLHQWIY